MGQNDYPTLKQTLLFVRRCFANRCLPHEVKLVEDTLQKRFRKEKPELLIGDRAYDSDPLDERLQQPGIQLIAPS